MHVRLHHPSGSAVRAGSTYFMEVTLLSMLKEGPRLQLSPIPSFGIRYDAKIPHIALIFISLDLLSRPSIATKREAKGLIKTLPNIADILGKDWSYFNKVKSL